MVAAFSDMLSTTRKRTRGIFGDEYSYGDEERSHRTRIASKIRSEYENVKELPFFLADKRGKAKPSIPKTVQANGTIQTRLIEDVQRSQRYLDLPIQTNESQSNSTALTKRMPTSRPSGASQTQSKPGQQASTSLIRREDYQPIKPEWHAPWKLQKVLSGHFGWVRALAMEPGNEWFCSGSGDRTIKIWDLASGTLKLTLTGHISTVRGLAVSPRHPYLFSCGEDRMVKCWDLEQNKVIRQYHGHLSGVYTLALHPTIDVLVTGGRDATVRVWDMRTRQNVHVLSGHTNIISDVKCQEADPQVISASLDKTIRLWDLAAGKTMTVLTHHKRQVRSLALHPTEFTFASGSADNIKQWKCPEGAFMQNFEGHNSIINTLSVNADGVLFSGGDNGSMKFWDWKSAYNYQSMDMIIQPGSLDAEAGIFCSTFDKTGLRLITGNADKSIHIYGQDDEAVCSYGK
jgi:pleiotropic regulator 1